MDFPSYYNLHIEAIRDSEFPCLREETYVDHAGTTLYAKSQLEAHHEDLMKHVYGNPHSRSASSQLTADTIEQIRYRILQFFNTTSNEYNVIFTSGCTQALKLVAETFDFSGREENNDSQSEVGCDEWGKGDNSNLPCLSSEQYVVNPGECVENGGYFYYLCDNHTSSQGMRELIAKRTKNIFCLDEEGLSKTLLPSHCIPSHGKTKNNLFVFPAQSNYSGQKYPLDWVKKIQRSEMKCQEKAGGQWYVLLDAAAFTSTSPLDLGKYEPDFVTVSFYKIFGYPTGLGALLVRNRACGVLKKEYFGGGTVAVSSARDNFHVFKDNISERFEDGTLPFLDIIAVRHGLDIINRLGGGMEKISQHTFCIAKFFHDHLQNLCHSNSKPLATIYSGGEFHDIKTQGAIVNFNLLRSNGDYIGFAEVDKMAQLHNIHLRTGCFCNIGACQKYLNISTEELKNNYQEGHVCGDDKDLINGKPTGSVRVSFGYMSTITDAVQCLKFIIECFLEGVNTVPSIELEATEFILNVQSRNQRSGNDQHTAKSHKTKEILQHSPKNIPVKNSDIIESCRDNKRILTNIYLYPVKSCAAFEVSEWSIGSKGLVYDREWMIVSDSGVTISQKREPRLCLIKPAIDLTNKQLLLDFPGMPRLFVALEHGGKSDTAQICTNKVCGDKVETYDCGEEASDWLSRALEKPGCRLLRQKPENSRQCKLKDISSETQVGNDLSLANESQFLLVSRESVKALIKKIEEKHEQTLSETKDAELLESAFIDEENILRRFRANLVIGGGTHFEEENWSNFKIGENIMESQGGCSRCQMICVDQDTGTRSKEPLRTLASWRGRKVPFGIHVRMESNPSKDKRISIGLPLILS